jgi:hypothetical protein
MTRISGILTCWTGLDPFDVVHQLREYAIENAYQFRFAIRFTPLELCVSSDIESIVKEEGDTQSLRTCRLSKQ